MKDSAGVHHLKKLSDAGITHVHLLPTFQFADVDDEKEKWQSVGKNISYSAWAFESLQMACKIKQVYYFLMAFENCFYLLMVLRK